MVAGLDRSVAQNSRSPGCSSPIVTCGPVFHWSAATRGSATPAWAYAHCVSPLQSKVSGPVAPQTYGDPSRLRAAAIALATSLFGGSVEPLGATPAAASASMKL